MYYCKRILYNHYLFFNRDNKQIINRAEKIINIMNNVKGICMINWNKEQTWYPPGKDYDLGNTIHCVLNVD